MRQKEIIKLDIADLTYGGEGIAKVSGMAVFVPDSVPGDELKVEITEVKKNFAKAIIKEIIKPSKDRVLPKCPISNECGGCQWQQINYESQLSYKTKIVKEQLERMGGIKNIKVNDTIGMKEPWGFRNKIQYPIGTSRKTNRIIMGYYRQATHDIVDIDSCPIEHPKLSHAAKIVKDILNKMGYSSYNGGRGLFRHLRARIGFGTGEVLLTFITNERAIPSSRELVKSVVENCKKADINVVGICHNLNPRQTNVVMGEKSWLLWGRDFLYDRLGQFRFKVSNASFYQTNPIQTEVLYNKALEYASVSKKDTIIDAYSGIGTLALWFSPYADYVYGIEEIKEAVKDAAENAEINKIKNCRFNLGKVEKMLSELSDADILVIDPPRGGCEEKVLRTITRSSFKKIIYISCNPATLARDLAYLLGNGFHATNIQPVDMFPHSFHIETVTKIERN